MDTYLIQGMGEQYYGGSVEVFFNLTVNDEVPSGITYSPENVTLTKNTVSSDLPLVPSITGSGAITSWELNNTNLPTGISFGSSNGTLYGTATQLWTTTAYKVWANNSGGSVVAYFNLTVNDQVPTGITYSPENVTLTNNTVSSDLPLVPSITGSGTITSWELNNTNLPSGISFGSSNGTLYGTATQLWTTTAYKVWANNTGGSVVAYFNLTVNDEVPSDITYSPENVTLTNNTASSDLPLVPSVTGSGAITSWALNNTNLPSGISFGSANGTLYGTATQLWTTTAYKVWANNTGGSVVAYFNLTVNDELPSDISYTPENVTLTNNTASSNLPLVPSITGSGEITSWAINASLPSGLSFGSNNGTIYGTPTELWNRTSYKVWANNTGGSVVAYFNLTVNDQLPTVLYSATILILTNNTVSSDLPHTPNISGSGVITSWEINATLPSGLTFSTNNGTIYGIPTELWPSTSYTIWGNNSGGSTSSTVSITVNDELPTIVYSPENVTLVKDTVSTDLPLTPAISGSGIITSWELNNTTLPSGISFGSSNGTLYGTATQLWTRTSYKVWANNSGGSVEVYFNLTVIDQVPTGISYSPENVTLTNDTASSDLPLVPSITGSGSITSWELNNTSLPSGISFGSTNGTLYGTATELWTRTAYKVWANNTGGSVVAYFNLTVNDQVPTLSYSPENLTLTKNQTSSDLPLNAVLTGAGAITSWEISPALPGGLSFGTSNGTIWGTPTTIRSLRTYTIWANNSGGSSSATVNITVNDELPNISYSPDWFVLTNNTAMSPTATPTNTGGAIPSTTIYSTGDAGQWNSIALDSNGYQHVAYSNQPSGSARTLMYATDASGTWVTLTIDSTGHVGRDPSIAIDSNGRIHITYARDDTGNQGIKYATCSSSCSSVSSWSTITIASGETFDGALSIDSSDNLHLVYYNLSTSSANLYYATCSSSCATASSWTNITIDGTSSAGVGGIDLIIDSNDHLHVAYSLFSTKDLKYITCSSSCTSASSWTNISVDTVGDVGRMPSIAVDSNDDLHISYHDDTNDAIKYAWCSSSCTTASSWSNTTLANGSSFGNALIQPGFNSDIEFDSDGHMHIMHIDWEYYQLLYSTCSSSCSNNSSWSHSVLRSDVLYEVSLVIDSNDEFNIVFYDPYVDDLEFMLLDSSSQIYGYSISPDLPNWLIIHPTTGTISGTPRELLTNTTFTITVRNSGGTNTTTITIEVLDQLPGLSYSPENLTLTINNQSSDLPLNATVTGSGAITSWAISPTLPSGLSFGTSNGTIWGIPTVLQTIPVTYTIWANNSGGSVNATVNITVNDEAPDISYNPDWFVLTRNVDMSPTAVPTNAGGEIPSTIIQSSGVGYQTVSMAIDSNGYLHISYYDETNKNLMYATNEGGSWSTRTVDSRTDVGVQSSIAVDSNDNVHIVYTITSWAVGGGLFNSDVLSYATCSSSCATSSWTKTHIAYQYGYDHKQFDLAIDSDDNLHFVFIKDYDDLMYVTCSSSCSSSNNNQYHSSWSIETIDAGDSFAPSIAIDSNDRLHISYSGDSTKNLKYATCYSSCSTSSSSWTITTVEAGNYSSGSSNYYEMKVSSIGIDSNGVKHIAYHNYTRSLGSGSSTYSHYYAVKYAKCSSSCTSASSWTNATIDDKAYSIDLEIDSNDNIHIFYRDDGNKWNHSKCSSSCLSNSSWSSTQVDVPATQFDKYSMAIDLQGNVHVANTDYDDKQLKYFTVNPSGVFHNFSISPDLPGGMKFDALTGEISGRPYVLMNNTTFTITVSNSGGVNTTTITIEVIDQVPVIAYSPQNLTLTKNQNSTNFPLTPTKTGSGTIVSWEINGTLPSGINFGSGNGTLWGVPTELWNTTTYMVWGNNTGGAAIAYLNITVVDEIPNISYSPENLNLTNNTVSSDLPLNATLTGSGAITSWAISPALPSGLSFGTSNGTIWGTPTSLMTLKTFTIWANNSGGSSFATVNITVNDEIPDISYNPDWFVLTNNTAMSPTATPTNTGGVIPSGIIDSNGNVGEYASIAIDSNGFKHISYYDATIYGTPSAIYDLKYATDTSGSWVVTTVDTAGNVGQYTSIAIDSNDVVHISYFDDTNNDLKYATCSSGCTTASNWDLVSVDTTSTNAGEYTSIAIDSNDGVHISYSDNLNLRYATCSSGCTSASNWTNVSVSRSAGTFTSIAIDANDALHIAYIGYPAISTVNYTTCSSGCTNASNWNDVYIPYTQSSYGLRDISLAIDSNGALHISYFDNTNKDLKYATCSSGCTTASNWGVVTLDSVGDTGYYTSIAIDSNDAIHISYHDNTNEDLKYATCSSGCTSGSNWNKVTLDETGNTGRDTSIAIDANDAVHISYRDYTNGDLKYIALDSSSNMYGYSISPDLPAGLNFNAFTGEISGTPTELLTNTTFTITARNSGGTNTTTITIEVIDNVPTVSYSPENLNLTNNTVSSDLPLVPTVTGSGDITSWEINATLPSGISFGSGNGTLWGVPTELWNTTSYMVWGNNSGGTAIAYLNITVIDQLPTISYSPADLILTNNTNSTDLPLAPTITGPGEIVTWEMNGTLPSGISFGNNNGTFWGVPTELWNQTQYMVWANNTGGSAVAYLNITVVDQLPTLSYVPENLTLLNNTQSPSLPLGPTLSGPGIILEWGISDGLPSGLSFGSDNGTIWGIPTERMNRTTFTIWANNSGGSATANINITVLHQQPLFNYSVLDLMLVNNTVMNNVTSTVTGGEIVSWEVSPDMPDGIALGANGNISGLPIVVQDRTMYMIWANNTGGSHVVYLNITIYDIIATLDYIPENLTLTRNESMTDLSPTYSGIVDSWEIHPALPDGLNFTNGTISGTPEYNMTRSTYTVYANNTGGSISHTINITVLEPMMEFEYIPANVTLVNNTASTDIPMVPILYNDGVAETWEIWPTLPSGLNFSSTNGTISGIATELQVIPVNYTIWANNSGGIASTVISITIVDQLPNLTYPGDLELMNNTNSTDLPMLPILDGAGVIVTWEINATLPSGLNFSSENGSIYGIATELWTKTQYTVWANNSGGSSMAMFNVTVVDQVPTDIGYSHEWLVLTRNENNSGILPLTPNLVGPGAITSWEINGTLPTGLNFSSENGTIWGIPTELYHDWQNITIYANNTGGSVVSNIAIMVNDQIPTISYNLSQVVFKNDTEMDSIEATHGGGPFITLAIHPQLPAGMYFGYDNATIWGQPTELTSKIEYTIWANNSGGSASTTINITIEDNGPVFDYISTEFTFYVDTEMAELPLTVTSSGGEIQNFSITPQLPAGLSFGELNGTIWGVATQDIDKTTFTISAYNPLGVYSVDIDIAVYDYLYGFELDPVWVANDSFMQPIKPTYIIPGATYSVGPDLPEGMSVNPNTGVVSGRPNGTTQLTFYTLIASVDGYTLSVSMKLGVLEDTDLDGMPDEIPPGGNAIGIVEDLDDDNDKVDDLTEIDCETDPLDAEDKPEFNSNGNCAPEPAGIGFLWCLPMILLLLLLMVLIIATKKKDEVTVESETDGETES